MSTDTRATLLTVPEIAAGLLDGTIPLAPALKVWLAANGVRQQDFAASLGYANGSTISDAVSVRGEGRRAVLRGKVAEAIGYGEGRTSSPVPPRYRSREAISWKMKDGIRPPRCQGKASDGPGTLRVLGDYRDVPLGYAVARYLGNSEWEYVSETEYPPAERMVPAVEEGRWYWKGKQASRPLRDGTEIRGSEVLSRFLGGAAGEKKILQKSS